MVLLGNRKLHKSVNMNSNLNSVVTFLGDFSIQLMTKDTCAQTKGKDRLPGREVAQKIRSALKKRGYDVSAIENSEPFYCFTLRVEGNEFSIDTILLGYHDMPYPQWSVSCIQKLSLIEKLFGSKEKEGYAEILDAIHNILERSKKISEIKWYRDVNTELNSNSYATTPLPLPTKRKATP